MALDRLLLWILAISGLAMFVGGNGIGVLFKQFLPPPYETVSLNVLPAADPICAHVLDMREHDFCVIERRLTRRLVLGHWRAEVHAVATGRQICGGHGKNDYSPNEGAMVLPLSVYVGASCRPRDVFTVEARRTFYEPVILFGFEIGQMIWKQYTHPSPPIPASAS